MEVDDEDGNGNNVPQVFQGDYFGSDYNAEEFPGLDVVDEKVEEGLDNITINEHAGSESESDSSVKT